MLASIQSGCGKGKWGHRFWVYLREKERKKVCVCRGGNIALECFRMKEFVHAYTTYIIYNMKTLTQIIKARRRNDGREWNLWFVCVWGNISPVGCSPVLYNAFSMYTSWDEGIGPLGIAPWTMKRMWPLLYVTEANVNVDDEQTNFTSSSSSSMTGQSCTSHRDSLRLQSKLGANTLSA